MIEKGLGLRTSGVGRPAARRAQVGTVDATMLTPPVNFFAEGAGFRNVGMILDYAKDLPFSAMDVSLAYAGKHRDMLAKLLVVIDKSIAWFNDDSHRDEAINILAKEMKSKRRGVTTTSARSTILRPTTRYRAQGFRTSLTR
jgi:ABC-type nitrate/sulfonate/bicarbonate transport system substrate-binding protein